MSSDRTEVKYPKYGIPITIKIIQKTFPEFVFGVIFPKPIVVAKVPEKKKALNGL